MLYLYRIEANYRVRLGTLSWDLAQRLTFFSQGHDRLGFGLQFQGWDSKKEFKRGGRRWKRSVKRIRKKKSSHVLKRRSAATSGPLPKMCAFLRLKTTSAEKSALALHILNRLWRCNAWKWKKAIWLRMYSRCRIDMEIRGNSLYKIILRD